MMHFFDNFRNALLIMGFGVGILGFEDVLLAYERTILVSDVPLLSPDMLPDIAIATHRKHLAGADWRPRIPEPRGSGLGRLDVAL